MLTIRPPRSEQEYLKVCKFVETVYRVQGYCVYLENKQFNHAILLAEDKGEIVGSIGVQIALKQKLLVEHYFGFNSSDIYPGCERAQIAEICKLASIYKYDFVVVKALIIALAAILQDEIKLVYACIKPTLLRVIKQYFHIPVYPLNLNMIEENIEEIYAGYFFQQPRPQTVAFFTQDAGNLPRFEKELSGKIRFDLEGFNFTNVNMSRHLIKDF